jgi:ribosome-binding ATPase YchF (GTP1/OBG family)
MKIGITGISNAGKTTVFNALTGLDVEATAYPTSGGEPNMGVVKVPDARLDVLSDIFKPKKTTPSIVHYIDYMGLTKGDIRQNRKVFEFIKDADVLVHVVRAFEDDAVAHPIRAVDPVSDVMTVEAELLLGDLELVERRLESMEQGKKKGGGAPSSGHELHRPGARRHAAPAVHVHQAGGGCSQYFGEGSER